MIFTLSRANNPDGSRGAPHPRAIFIPLVERWGNGSQHVAWAIELADLDAVLAFMREVDQDIIISRHPGYTIGPDNHIGTAEDPAQQSMLTAPDLTIYDDYIE